MRGRVDWVGKWWEMRTWRGIEGRVFEGLGRFRGSHVGRIWKLVGGDEGLQWENF